MKAVIQAGGKGTRLKPYTMVLPKPLMPVGSRPVIELLLKWLRRTEREMSTLRQGISVILFAHSAEMVASGILE
jgi:dTDP-glucose pyrophosphorylase